MFAVPIEVKSGDAISMDYFDGLRRWDDVASANPANNYVIYAGTDLQRYGVGTIIGWRDAGSLVEKVESNRGV